MTPSPTPQCRSYLKDSLRFALDYCWGQLIYPLLYKNPNDWVCTHGHKYPTLHISKFVSWMSYIFFFFVSWGDENFHVCRCRFYLLSVQITFSLILLQIILKHSLWLGVLKMGHFIYFLNVLDFLEHNFKPKYSRLLGGLNSILKNKYVYDD